MASTTPRDLYASLRSLHRAAQNGPHPSPNLSLPDRSRLASTDTAIAFVAQHTEHLYAKQESSFVEIIAVKHGVENLGNKVNHFESGVKGALTSLAGRLDSVEERLDGVEENLGELRSQVKNVESQVKNVESQVKTLQNNVQSIENLVRNTTSIQLNSLAKWRDDPVHPIFSSAGGLAPDFPNTVYQFWALLMNPTALTRLAQHYEIGGWERWQRSSSHETDVTEFLALEDAVATCPERCLQALAGKWGLHYHQLQPPESRTKRKADSEDSAQSRRRPRVDFDEVVESVISQDDRGRYTWQNRNIRIGPRQPLPESSEISFTEVLRRYPNPPGHLRVSFESAEIRHLPRPSTPSPERPAHAAASSHS
ncbi:hypothetical protein MPDQ_002403 [Monascus purpureus]|uniref:Uncharacterized protein n=1 Tax=Monascus purpureus TaxID=5098 RepID=A0A507QKG9_MONPU|nr:hypothetical protein MPDQ_002403 [Monascus purpureus]BDD57617.1 hypothetical protein MAP00_002968 [Monascus purpureus]